MFFSFLENGLGPLLIFVLLINAILYKRIKINSDIFNFIILLYLMVLALGFRTIFSGVDTASYYQYYNEVASSGVNTRDYEFGFFGITLLSHYLGGWDFFLAFSVILQLLSVYLAAYFFKIKQPNLAVFLYVALLPGFDLLTNGLRQGIALSVGSVFLVLSLYRNNLKLFNLIAIAFHKSTIVYIFSFFMPKNEKINISYIKALLILGVVVVVIGYMGSFLDGSIKFEDILPLPLIGTNHTLGAKIDMYLYIEKQLLSESMKAYFLVLSYIILFPFIYGIFFKPHLVKSVLSFGLFCLCLHFIFLLIWWTNFAYRFMYISYIPSVLLFVKCTELIGLKRLRYYMFLILVFGILSTYGSNNFSSFSLLNLY
jgi:hypothetical protein